MKELQKSSIALLTILVFAGGCREAPRVTPMAGRPDVSGVASDNREVNEAIARARAELPKFLESLRNPERDVKGHMIKKAFPAKEGGEEAMWLQAFSFEHGVFDATLLDDPALTVGVKRARISRFRRLRSSTGSL